jgi:integrase
VRPEKPYDDFPLFPHATRRWAKKIRGRMHYFGPWNDWQGALKKYQEQRDDLHAGRTPRVQAEGFAVRDLLNHFRTSKKRLADAGEITPRTYAEYCSTCDRISEAFGRTRLVLDLAADDFGELRAALAKRWGPVALGNEVQRVRSVFKYCYDAGLIDRPVRFGPEFKRPKKKVLRKARAERGKRMFEAAELRRMIAAAGQPLKAMLLLGVNCGFGNADVGTLPLTALDLEGGWVSYPRPKTGVERRAALWPETVAAMREALARRPETKAEVDVGLAFVTKYGHRWFTGTTNNPLSHEMEKLLSELGIHRAGLNFYALRHTFETIAGESRDQVAVDHVMGHVRDDMASVYREKISDERLKAVAQQVWAWLFPSEEMRPSARHGS